jgi:hypothetical protein
MVRPPALNVGAGQLTVEQIVAAPEAAVDAAKVVRERARSTPRLARPVAYSSGVHLEHDGLDRGSLCVVHSENIVVVGSRRRPAGAARRRSAETPSR